MDCLVSQCFGWRAFGEGSGRVIFHMIAVFLTRAVVVVSTWQPVAMAGTGLSVVPLEVSMFLALAKYLRGF